MLHAYENPSLGNRTPEGIERRRARQREYRRRHRELHYEDAVAQDAAMADEHRTAILERQRLIRSMSAARFADEIKSRAAESVLVWKMSPDRALDEAEETLFQLRFELPSQFARWKYRRDRERARRTVVIPAALPAEDRRAA